MREKARQGRPGALGVRHRSSPGSAHPCCHAPGAVPRPIAFDLSRLYLGALGRTPRGIDRVDLGFARRLFDDPMRQDVGLVPTPARMGVLRAAEARRVTERVERHWREGVSAPDGGQGTALRRWLEGSPLAPSPPRAGIPSVPWHLGPMLAAARGSGVRPAARFVPRDAIYLNTGQVLLGFPWCFGWLDRRPDVRPVFLIHDVIPLRFPEYAGPVLQRHHARAVANAARRAAGLLATSHAAADDVREALRPLGAAAMPIHVAPLPVSPSLLAPAAAPPPEGCYFVSVGIMDQRKNYGLLLRVWRDLVRAGTGPVPKLAIIGAPGLRTAGLRDLIARSPGLSDVVMLASGLPSAVMRDILRGARALLMPSFTEGFGLPLIEARALGVPIVASDIPAHREVGGPGTLYLDPLDGPGWRRGIMQLASGDRLPAAPEPASPVTWPSYVEGVLAFLEAL